MDPAANVIAALALLVSILGYLDNRRRIGNAAIAFQLEFTSNGARAYQIRNVGTRSVWWLRIDASSVEEYELQQSITFGELKQGSATEFGLTSASRELPDSITLTFRKNQHSWRRIERTIPFQPTTLGPKIPPTS